MSRTPRLAAALVVFLPALAVGANRGDAQEPPVVVAYRKDMSFNLDIRFPAGLPESSRLVVLSRCTVVPSGKVFSDSKIRIFRRPGAGAEFRWKTSALSPGNVEIRAGDHVVLELELDGQRLPSVEATVAAAPAATEPTAVRLQPRELQSAAAPTPAPDVAVATPQATAPAEVSAAPEVVRATPTVPAAARVEPAAPTAIALPPALGGTGVVAERSPSLATPTAVRTVSTLPTAVPDATQAPAVSSAGAGTSEVSQVPVPVEVAASAEGVARPGAGSTRPGWPAYLPWVGGGLGLLLVSLISAAAARGRSKRSATATRPAVVTPVRAAPDEPARASAPVADASAPTAVDEPPAAAERVGIHVESLIARGGLCDIFLVRRGSDRRRCALKVLRPEFRSSSSLSEGLVREGEIIRQLNEAYPGQVFIRLFDQGFFHDTGADHPYLVLEYVDGPNLRNHVRQRGALEYTTAVSAARDLADGLARVHESALVHGDISPENVLWVANSDLRREGEPRFRLIDFGDSRKFDLDIRADEIAGKPAFISPEQTTGAAATPASDIYSLGMVLYFLLAGGPAFQSGNSLDILRMHREEPLRFPTSFPAEVRDAIAYFCEKDPDLRPSAGEAFDILDGLLSGPRGVA